MRSVEFKCMTTLFLLSFWLVQGQSKEEANTLISAYLVNNGTMKQYADAYDNLLDLMSKQYPKSDRNGNGWLYLEKNKKKALMEIKDLLMPIYLSHFSLDEIGQLNAFYKSKTGQQLILDKDKMNEIQQEEYASFFSSPVGQKVVAKREVLYSEIAAASEYWSSDLYQTATLLLKE